MRYNYSVTLLEDVSSAVNAAFKSAGIVNIAIVAEQSAQEPGGERRPRGHRTSCLAGSATPWRGYRIRRAANGHDDLHGNDGRSPFEPPYSTSIQYPSNGWIRRAWRRQQGAVAFGTSCALGN